MTLKLHGAKEKYDTKDLMFPQLRDLLKGVAQNPISENFSLTLGQTPLERYVTTYSSDYKPPSECHPQVNQLKLRSEAEAAPARISPPQTHRETWSIIHPYFYKTTNSIYGSGACSQPPSCSLFPASLRPCGIPTPSMSGASGVVDSSLTEARTQEVGAARENEPFLCEVKKGQLHYVFVGEANVLEQLEAKDELQQMIDVLDEEGEIVLSSHVGLACCEDFLRCVCREARRQHLLHLPVACSPIVTIKDAEHWAHSACGRGLGPATGLKNSVLLQPTSRQCCCCARQTECPNRCRFKMQTFPPCVLHGSTLPPAHVQLTFYCTVPSRKPPLTEYQARYTAEWAQPKMQQCYIHHHHPPCT